MASIVFYDLVAYPGGPFISPVAMKVRLALLNKHVRFEVKELTYGALRSEWSGKGKPLKVDKATVPFIQKPDGSYLIESNKIVEWLDTEYPDRPNTYLPEASLPVDVNSLEYVTAVKEVNDLQRSFPNRAVLPFIYYTRTFKLLSKEDQEYFVSPERWGPGGWEEIVEGSKDQDAVLVKAKEWAGSLEKLLSDKLFFASETAPGYLDFTLRGAYQAGRVNGPAVNSLFIGKLGEWLERIDDRFADGLKDVHSRDVPI